MSTIYILWLRQLKRYLRSVPRIVGTLAQPLLFFLALGYGFGPIFEKASGASYIQFIAPGIIAMGIIFTAIFSGIELIWDRQFGFLKETMVAPTSRSAIMLGRIAGGATIATIQGILVFLMVLIFGFTPASWTYAPLALVVMILSALVFTALGTVIAVRMRDMQAFPIIMNFLVMPLFFLSGSLFPLEGFSRGVQIATRFNPLFYGVDGLHRSLLGASGDHIALLGDSIILLLVGALLVAVSTWLFARIEA